MRKLIFFLSFLTHFLLSSQAYSNGVGVANAATGVYLRLLNTKVNVSVEGQVAVITTTQTFKNLLGSDKTVSYAFPLPEGASATGLSWKVNGQWYQAPIAPTPQDTTLPGGTMNTNLRNYLGSRPLFYAIPQQVRNDSVLIVTLNYVQLLPYELGNVSFTYPNNYTLIQSAILDFQELNFSLSSPRTIDSLKLLSAHPLTQFSNNGHLGYIKSLLNESAASTNYRVKYTLSLNELGLFSYSTSLPDSVTPDTLGGFFMFVAEPDPGTTTQVIKKVFTLIVDRSGSMAGDKIIQARNASKFIVENLNAGDKFNIVDFSSDVRSFRSGHVNYTNQSRDSALNYINAFIASGGTNISGSFSTAVPHFSTANDSTANIIIFFTDGQATEGITNTTQLLSHVRNLIISAESNINLFTFGIGSDVNVQLLTLLASQNSGLSEFLANNELQEKISNFYLKIRNPVLLNPQISFSSNAVIEVNPNPLPNLYKGQQMIVTGRYLQPGPVTVTLSGNAFNQPVTYQYTFNRSDSAVTSYQFLTKIWAKQKIEKLLILYYSLNPNSPEAQAIKQQIIQLSISYGVISPFTSFGGPTGTGNGEITNDLSFPGTYKLYGNYPNPFNPSTTIKFAVSKNITRAISIKIYNSIGQLVKVLNARLTGKGVYEVKWGGDLIDGSSAPSGLYFYVIDFGDERLSGKMMLVK